MVMGRNPIRGVGLGLLLLLVGISGCDRVEGDWSEPGVTTLYRLALESIRQELGVGDSLVVDPRPRFVVEESSGDFRMGDYNRWGDREFGRALAADSLVVACRIEGDSCGDFGPEGVVIVSEVFPLNRREGVILALHLERLDETGATRGMVLQFRHGKGGWRVSRIVPR